MTPGDPAPVAAGVPVPGDAARRWRGVRQVLAVRLDNLGDVLMTTPALAAMRHTWPQARLTLLASHGGAALADHLPMLDEVLPFDAPWVRHEAGPAAPPDAELRLVQQLAARRFDAAVVFTVCTQSALPAALACRMAGIALRLAHVRENPYALLTDWIRDPDRIATGMRHETQRQLDLVAAVGCRVDDVRLRFQLRTADLQHAQAQLRQAGVGGGTRYFVVHCGASAPSRRYMADGFSAAADLIARRSGSVPVFTGSASEAGQVHAVRSGMAERSVDLSGSLPLGPLAGVLAGAQVLVSNNTGPVHIAAALGTPVVDLYALTNPQHTPWQVPARVLSHDVPCRHCLQSRCPQGHHSCLRGVTPRQVADAALELMHETRVGVPPGRRRVPAARPGLAGALHRPAAAPHPQAS